MPKAHPSAPRPPSPRELQMLKLASQGHTDKEIAGILGISFNTVSTYWKRLKERYQAASRTSLVVTLLGDIERTDGPAEVGERLQVMERSAPFPKSGQFSTRQLVNIMDGLAVGVLLLDADGRVQLINESLRRLLGQRADPETFIGLPLEKWLEACLQPDMPGLAAWMRNISGAEIGNQTYSVRFPRGRILDIDYTQVMSDYRPVAHLWQFKPRPSTTIQSGIVSAPALYSLANESAPPFVLVAAGGQLRAINAAAEDLFEIDGSYLVNRPLGEAHPAFLTPWFRSVLVSPVATVLDRSGRLDGMEGWFHVSFRPLGGDVAIEIVDVSDQRSRFRDVVEYARFGKLVGAVLPSLIDSSPDTLANDLRRLLGVMCQYLHSQRAGIFSLDASSGEARPLVTWRSGLCLPVTPLSFARSDPYFVWWQQKLDRATPSLIDLADVEASDCENIRRLREAGTTMMLLVPIQQYSSTVGFIQFESKKKLRPLSEPSQEVLNMVANCLLSVMRRLNLVDT